jgi:RNase P subunit RPR2
MRVSISTESVKACKKCEQTLNVIENFYIHTKSTSTYRPVCKQCHNDAAYKRRGSPSKVANPLKTHTTGRPGWREYSKEKREDIMAAFARGDKTAAIAHKWGVSSTTAYAWRKTCQVLAMNVE